MPELESKLYTEGVPDAKPRVDAPAAALGLRPTDSGPVGASPEAEPEPKRSKFKVDKTAFSVHIL